MAGRRMMVAAMAAALAAGTALAGPTVESGNETLLQAIADQDGNKVLDLVARRGVNGLNYVGHRGESALTLAVAARLPEYYNFFLARGADANFPNAEGNTGLHIAARNGDVEAIGSMLAYKADVNVANRGGETPLILAVQQRRTGAVRALVAAGADPDKRDRRAGLSARDYARRDSRDASLLQMLDSKKAAPAAPTFIIKDAPPLKAG